MPDRTRASRPTNAALPGRLGEGLLTLQQVAAYLNLSPKTVRRLVARHVLPCVHFGRTLRFEARDVFRVVESRKEQ